MATAFFKKDKSEIQFHLLILVYVIFDSKVNPIVLYITCIFSFVLGLHDDIMIISSILYHTLDRHTVLALLLVCFSTFVRLIDFCAGILS